MAPFAYNLAFSRAADNFFELFGLTPAYRDEMRCTIYTLESRTWFTRDCRAGEDIHVDCRLLDLDTKRTHLWLRLFSTSSNIEASHQEALIMHMRRDPGSQPVAEPFPASMYQGLSQILERHRSLG